MDVHGGLVRQPEEPSVAMTAAAARTGMDSVQAPGSDSVEEHTEASKMYRNAHDTSVRKTYFPGTLALSERCERTICTAYSVQVGLRESSKTATQNLGMTDKPIEHLSTTARRSEDMDPRPHPSCFAMSCASALRWARSGRMPMAMSWVQALLESSRR